MRPSPLPRILRRRGEPDYPTFLELFFDLVYIFMLSRLSAGLAGDLTVRGAAETAVLLMAAWWVWVLTAWLTDLFNPRLPVIQATVLAVMFGTLLMAIAVPYAFADYGWLFVAGYFGIHLVRDAVLIPGTRVNRPIQARSIRVFFWFGVTALPWVAGAFAHGTARLLLWSVAVAGDLGSARLGWPTPKLGRTELASQIFTGMHLSERHREIFIISLGELILSCGLGLAGSGFQAGRVATSFVGFAGAVVLFQLYFHRVRQLLAPPAVMVVERVRPGTSTSYSHLVMVAGVLVVSTSVALVIDQPFGAAPAAWIVAILGGPALFLLGSCLFDAVVTGRLLWSRASGIVVLCVIGPVAALLPPLAILIVANLVLLLILVWETLPAHSRPVRITVPT
ncbi:low temperature requirement protein A [Micromonospora terminaliae]|uniref:Low temperature requirement protein A n=1 Tax=Micromonospora terminaliae TaxID=1914461 RepID=A0AAJ2ZE58_9ACTN|nr:low temperature requirement protein A [Micromonospora terminaliae]NES28168.1 low temperature requirement protein A [Micromonospora terminaliae]QGL47092.1 low temperature requirement protein A [Micromonospora terminaliae]